MRLPWIGDRCGHGNYNIVLYYQERFCPLASDRRKNYVEETLPMAFPSLTRKINLLVYNGHAFDYFTARIYFCWSCITDIQPVFPKLSLAIHHTRSSAGFALFRSSHT